MENSSDCILLEEARYLLRFARIFYLSIITVLMAVIVILTYKYVQETQGMETYIRTLKEAYEQCKNQTI